ncbi:hypothetical protein ACSDR0_01620 [Streptosporangium sp. G11]|uniref:hypothetical protein n=1 Tax=Streptosporangium sp. G11 TaxID=3436926 RepID=UPI003EBE60FC
MRKLLGLCAGLAVTATLTLNAAPASAESGWYLLKNTKSGLCLEAQTTTGRLMMMKCNKNVANQHWENYNDFQYTFLKNRASLSGGCLAALTPKDVRVQAPCVKGDLRFMWEWGGVTGPGFFYRYWRSHGFPGKDLTAWNDGTVSLSVSCPPCTEASKMDWDRLWV